MARPADRKVRQQELDQMLERLPSGDLRRVAPPRLDFDWRPVPFEEARRSKRGAVDDGTPASRIPRARTPHDFRWAVLAGVIAGGVALALAFRFVAAVPAQRADEVAAEWSAAIDAVTLLTDRAVAADAAADDVAALRDAVAILDGLADRDLPAGLPFLPSGPLDDLKPVRDELQALSDRASSAVGRLALAAAYGAARPSVLALPRLPTEAPVDLVDELGGRIDESIAATTAALAPITNDPTFTSVRADINETLFWLTEWRDRYLLAVRRADTEEATASAAEARERVGTVLAELDGVIATTSNAASEELEDLVAALQALAERL
jgi:hypothetical protein